MSEVIAKLTSDRIKVKGGEYVQDLVRCEDCKHWQYGKDHCALHDMGMWADCFCSLGVRKDQ